MRTEPLQLELPLRWSPIEPPRDGRIHPEAPLAVRTGVSAGRVWVELRALLPIGPAHASPSMRVDLQVTGAVRCTINGRPNERWPLTPGLPAGGRGPFRRAFMFGQRALEARMWGYCPRPSLVDECTRRLHARLASASMAAFHMCQAAPRDLARRFDPRIRFSLYRALIDDPTGRLAQLAQVCPGALVLALGLRGDDPLAQAVRHRVLRDAISGRRLGPMLDDAIHGWGACRAAAPLGRVGPPILDGLEGAQRQTALRRQRLLVRRAAPQVPPTLLTLPPPVAFAPEDIPVRASDQLTWFRAVKADPTLWRPLPGVATDQQQRLAAFISRNAVTLGRHRPAAVAAQVRHIVRYCVANAVWPGRQASLRRIEAAQGAWQSRLQRVQRYASEVLGAEDGELRRLPPTRARARVLEILSTPFPEPPVGGAPLPAGSITPIRTVGDLLSEAEYMRHCAADHAANILAGACFLYRAEVRGARLTVELIHSRGGWVTGQIRGRANRAPTEEELEVLASWLPRAPATTRPTNGTGPLR